MTWIGLPPSPHLAGISTDAVTPACSGAGYGDGRGNVREASLHQRGPLVNEGSRGRLLPSGSPAALRRCRGVRTWRGQAAPHPGAPAGARLPWATLPWRADMRHRSAAAHTGEPWTSKTVYGS